MASNKTNGNEKRIGFISLGCPKALVDSEQIITRLKAEGYVINPNYTDSDLVIVNTCGFIDEAIDESLEAIHEAMEENGKVIVTGCLGAKGDIVKDHFPNVLAVTGPHALQAVVEAVHRELPQAHDPFLHLIPPQGIKLTPNHYAYLKISEGCNHRCSFCIIPSLRGDLVSRPVDEVLTDANNLVEAGVKELLIISQDTSVYGVDIKYRTRFWRGRPVKSQITDLAAALGELGVWVRLHYVYPYPHVDHLIPLMADGKILPYLDIPFQHASPEVLKAMRKPAHSDNTLERITRWREVCPNIAIRSTFIVGFPGETEEDFQQLLQFLEMARLDRVGCFTYSPVEGASANALPDPVPEQVKLERLEALMALQESISRDKLLDRIGKIETVLVDEVSENEVIARSYCDAPQIDGVVIVNESASCQPGDFIRVEIVDSLEHDLIAKIVDSN